MQLVKNQIEFLSFYTRARLESEVFRNFAGYLWWILDPLFGVGVYYILFKVLLNRGGDDYIPFLFIGLVVWKWFGDSISKSSGSILGNLGLMKRVRVEKHIFPTVEVLYNTWKFIVVFVLIVAFYLVLGFPLTWNHLYLPVVLVSQMILILGGAYFLSSIVPFIPDLNFIIGYSLRLIFYPSGVLFALDSIPKKYIFYVMLNPMAGIIQGYRNIIMKGEPPLFQALLLSVLIGGVFGFIGLIILKKYDQEYPKIS